MNELILTNHGRKRIKQRIGIGKSNKKVERVASIALEKGLHINDFKGEFKRYLEDNYMKYQCGDNMRVHASQIWIFEENRLVTVKPIPSRYARKYMKYLKRN